MNNNKDKNNNFNYVFNDVHVNYYMYHKNSQYTV